MAYHRAISRRRYLTSRHFYTGLDPIGIDVRFRRDLSVRCGNGQGHSSSAFLILESRIGLRNDRSRVLEPGRVWSLPLWVFRRRYLVSLRGHQLKRVMRLAALVLLVRPDDLPAHLSCDAQPEALKSSLSSHCPGWYHAGSSVFAAITTS